MFLKPVIAGALSFLPVRRQYTGTGGTASARYCYRSWVTMLRLLQEANLATAFRAVVELGPGDTIGVGLAAILSGADEYYALDVLDHADQAGNIRVLEDLIQLLQTRAQIPGDEEFPRTYPRPPDYEYPAAILSLPRMAAALGAERIRQLRQCVEGRTTTGPIAVRYVVPWTSQPVVARDAVDLVYSHAVLQDIAPAQLQETHEKVAAWLRPGGVCYHHVDLSYPAVPGKWNERWVYPDLLWRALVGRRPYYFSRVPLSGHLDAMQRAGLELVRAHVKRNTMGHGRAAVARRFRDLPEDDFTAEAVTLIGVRPGVH